MNLRLLLFPIVAALAWVSTSSADIVGSDFSDSAVFNAAGGNYDNSAGSVDDLDAADNISVTGWTFTGTGALIGFDANAQVGMPNDNVTKFNGDGQSLPAVGTSAAGLACHSFGINIPAGTTLDLSDVTFDWRQATGTTSQVRWLAFNTSLDGGNVIWSEVGLIRNNFDSESISLAGAQYQGLTAQTVTFNFYAGGTGSGDIDIDTIVIDGTAITVPEPTTALPMFLVAMGLYSRRRKK